MKRRKHSKSVRYTVLDSALIRANPEGIKALLAAGAPVDKDKLTEARNRKDLKGTGVIEEMERRLLSADGI